MTKLKILTIFGTRPEVIKVFPVLRALDKDPSFESIAVSTSQHREMIDDLLTLFDINPGEDLNIIRENQSLVDISTRVLSGLDPILYQHHPDLILIQGDTTTAFIGALTAFYRKIPIGHIEAGLRSKSKMHPFPEEINRRLITQVADLHFAPTRSSAQNLSKEGVNHEKIFTTGNTVVDSLQYIVGRKGRPLKTHLPEKVLDFEHLIIVTAHRRENWGKPLEELCRAIQDLVRMYPDLSFLFPVHLNPKVRDTVFSIIGEWRNVFLVDPLPYDAFIRAITQSYLVITDSGGIQEECPSLGTPVLVFRKVTERPENIAAGGMKIIGLSRKNIVREVCRLLDNPEAHQQMITNHNPYGDGQAARRITQAILHHFQQADRPDSFVPQKGKPFATDHYLKVSNRLS
jgi:UDP-N-acetylglucosamine 2-epimerase (non-hydrolysing)